jgi:acyl carrier protein
VLSRALATRFREVLGAVELHNLYGPTETTIEVMAQRTGPDGTGRARLPVGRPIPGARVYVLDAAGRPTPVGMPGEIHIGGLPVTRGYLDQAAVTAERFVPDPFERGGRLYRTGDRGRWMADGVLDFLGRADDQVKIRGHRVEPAEVAVAVSAHPSVNTAAVVPRPGPDGTPQLVAYVVSAAPSAPFDAEDLRAFLARRLPDAMVPSAFVALPALPLGPNGKLARAGLPAPAPVAAEGVHTAPRTETERRLARIWSDLLEVPAVGADAEFFTLGGHSLLATRIVARIREEFGVEVPIAELLRSGATVQSLSAVLSQALVVQSDPGELFSIVAELNNLSDAMVADLLARDDEW